MPNQVEQFFSAHTLDLLPMIRLYIYIYIYVCMYVCIFHFVVNWTNLHIHNNQDYAKSSRSINVLAKYSKYFYLKF